MPNNHPRAMARPDPQDDKLLSAGPCLNAGGAKMWVMGGIPCRRTIMLCRRLFRNFSLLPATAQRFIDCDQVLTDGFFALCEGVLGLVKRALGINDVDKAHQSLQVKLIG